MCDEEDGEVFFTWSVSLDMTELADCKALLLFFSKCSEEEIYKLVQTHTHINIMVQKHRLRIKIHPPQKDSYHQF